MARKYNKSNCDSTLRAVIEDKFGNKISLFGTHSFEWSIVKEIDGKVTMTTFPNRLSANKEFKKYQGI